MHALLRWVIDGDDWDAMGTKLLHVLSLRDYDLGLEEVNCLEISPAVQKGLAAVVTAPIMEAAMKAKANSAQFCRRSMMTSPLETPRLDNPAAILRERRCVWE
ncbi:hypothetical protein HanIR_Chr14g0728501 [Helianthus annuus]|nr:hypothetical protein HanIR_Chr14g0728501 [Helianthus annuus]